tara:strand:- start:327 stop:713 length:387 start_codon:yes stop_codon:yes gene_type:complete
MNPFDYLNAINATKEDVMVDDVAESKYNAFLINRGLSYFVDTVLYANEMNLHNHIDKRMQFDFLQSSIRKRKRFSKWAKAEKVTDLEVVKEYYGYSNEKAKAILPLLNDEQLDQLKLKLNKGGKSGRK